MNNHDTSSHTDRNSPASAGNAVWSSENLTWLEGAWSTGINTENVADTWNKHDDNLENSCADNNAAEHEVLGDTFENVHFIVESS